MSPILVEATGRSTLEYAREVLFVPLGIPSEPVVEPVLSSRDGVVDAQALEQYYAADFAWPVDPQGFHEGAGSQKLRPRDLALFGQLFLDEGRWGDQQVVPTAWVERSTSALVSIRDVTEAYGYMWWVTEIAGDPAYLALGFGGQMIAVVPNRELVVVVATEFDLNDPLLPTKVIRAPVLIELVNTWVAPHFPSADGQRGVTGPAATGADSAPPARRVAIADTPPNRTLVGASLLAAAPTDPKEMSIQILGRDTSAAAAGGPFWRDIQSESAADPG